MLLSIVIPCYNEYDSIMQTYRTITNIIKADSDKEGYSYELIFIDDGSNDETLKIIQNFCASDANSKYISFSRNFGKESAMLAGLTYAEGDCVVIMDADLQHPPELIPKMIQYYHEGYDQVIAKRNRHGDKKSKSLAANLYYKFVNKIVDVDLTDGIGDFRLLSRKAVNALLSINEYNRFSKGLFSWVGFKKKIIEYENSPRIAGETKWNFKKLLSYGIDGITSFNNKPLRICFMLGAISILLGFF
jgi:polyisoprenyl-phosphate glycosyltransferase